MTSQVFRTTFTDSEQCHMFVFLMYGSHWCSLAKSSQLRPRGDYLFSSCTMSRLLDQCRHLVPLTSHLRKYWMSSNFFKSENSLVIHIFGQVTHFRTSTASRHEYWKHQMTKGELGSKSWASKTFCTASNCFNHFVDLWRRLNCQDLRPQWSASQ